MKKEQEIKFKELNKSIEQLTLDIKYSEIPKRKRDMELYIRVLSKMSSDVGEIITKLIK